MRSNVRDARNEARAKHELFISRKPVRRESFSPITVCISGAAECTFRCQLNPRTRGILVAASLHFYFPLAFPARTFHFLIFPTFTSEAAARDFECACCRCLLLLDTHSQRVAKSFVRFSTELACLPNLLPMEASTHRREIDANTRDSEHKLIVETFQAAVEASGRR